MRRVGQSLFLFVATLVTLWWFFVRAPGPHEVCEHIVEVTLTEAQAADMNAQSESALVTGLQERCIEHKLDKIKLRGRVKYARYAKCVMSASTLLDIESC